MYDTRNIVYSPSERRQGVLVAFGDLLFSLLTSGAHLVAAGTVIGFAEGAGGAAFEAIKKRLSSRHDVASLSLLEGADESRSSQAALRDDLKTPEIESDMELRQLAQTLRDAILELPRDIQMRYAVNVEEIRAGGSLLFENVQGVKAQTVTSDSDMTFKNVTAPSGKT